MFRASDVYVFCVLILLIVMASFSGTDQCRQRFQQRSFHGSVDTTQNGKSCCTDHGMTSSVATGQTLTTGHQCTVQTTVQKPKHPQYQEYSTRLESYVGWPGRYVPKTPEELSTAGFFYIGSADRVTCFQCGITLRDWEAEHDPIKEHENYSKNCEFIKQFGSLNELCVERRPQPHGSNDGQLQTNLTSGSHPGHASPKVKDVQSDSDLETDCAGRLQPHGSNNGQLPTNLTSGSGPGRVSPKVKDIQSDSDLEMDCAGSHFEKLAIRPKSERLTQLLEENKRLKEEGICRLCWGNPSTILFLPCGHLMTCQSCAESVRECVKCGKSILGTVRTFRA